MKRVMEEQQEINYQKIQEAIQFAVDNYTRQPTLEEIAEHIHLSPYHFQRVFSKWAGVSPKKFIQYLSLQHAKSLLLADKSAMETYMEVGLSSSSRLHDLFVQIEGMTPSEFKNKGESLVIRYSSISSPFGGVLVASTDKGICYMAFYEDYEVEVSSLKASFPRATFKEVSPSEFQDIVRVFERSSNEPRGIKLHLKGTPFQLKVWESLLKIPEGRLVSYSYIAGDIGRPKAARAVGTAIGSNPVAYLIPCHRVIQSSGMLGGYKWDLGRKACILGWESARENFLEKK